MSKKINFNSVFDDNKLNADEKKIFSDTNKENKNIYKIEQKESTKKIRTFIDLKDKELMMIDKIIIYEMKRKPLFRATRASIIRELVNVGLQNFLTQNPEYFD
jgi:hypothetical protein